MCLVRGHFHFCVRSQCDPQSSFPSACSLTARVFPVLFQFLHHLSVFASFRLQIPPNCAGCAISKAITMLLLTLLKRTGFPCDSPAKKLKRLLVLIRLNPFPTQGWLA